MTDDTERREMQPERVISTVVAHHVLWTYGHADRGVGYPPGSFTEALLKAIGRADAANRGRLMLGFPEYVVAVVLLEEHPDGVRILADIAAGGARRGDTQQG